MEITELIDHPERMDRDTLYELRSMLAIYPYFQTARLLMLQNLYLLHDPTFDEELRRASVCVADRRVLFRMVEAIHYKLTTHHSEKETTNDGKSEKNRTISLINNFLENIPQTDSGQEKKEKTKRKPTPADAAIDYVAYLLETEESEEEKPEEKPQMKGQQLIDTFIENDKGKIVLNETPQFVPQIDEPNDDDGKNADESFFTETLARIYIKQGRYDKALEIITRLSLNYPKKNTYFADQIRFLQKLIINNKQK